MIRRLLLSLAWRVAQNPKLQAEAGKLANKAAEKAKPALLKGARRAGELSRNATDEIKYQIDKASQKSKKD
ncbi:MAG: hypothetical protein ACON4G_03750 [Candidatus Puniceispirillaceae bacterium]